MALKTKEEYKNYLEYMKDAYINTPPTYEEYKNRYELIKKIVEEENQKK